MMILITTDREGAHEATEAELAGSPHRQISQALTVLPVGSTVVLTVPNDVARAAAATTIRVDGVDPVESPPFTVTTYHTVIATDHQEPSSTLAP